MLHARVASKSRMQFSNAFAYINQMTQLDSKDDTLVDLNLKQMYRNFMKVQVDNVENACVANTLRLQSPVSGKTSTTNDVPGPDDDLSLTQLLMLLPQDELEQCLCFLIPIIKLDSNT